MKKTLYVTDLDATLLRNDKSVSEATARILNFLIDRGMLITYATARSGHSAAKLVGDIDFRLPAIIRNGTVFADPKTGRETEIIMFAPKEAQAIGRCMEGLKLCGFVTTYLAGVEKKLYLEGRVNKSFGHYLEEHSTDRRLLPVKTEEEMFQGEICYFTFIGDKTELDPLYERVREGGNWTCIYQQDVYTPDYWLELCPKDATKAKAARKLKERYGCERLVVFGDSLNDISMFQAADEAYAVENAMEEVKALATGIISGNEEDGVARWLQEEYGRSAAAGKREIRRRVLALRDGLDRTEQERGRLLLTERILGHQWFYNSHIILGFASCGSEIDTRELLQEALRLGKRLFLPKVTGEEQAQMRFFRVRRLEELKEGYKGILEPSESCEEYIYSEAEAPNTLMLMPGAAFDSYRNRIGYGKGFYDRFLADKEALQLRTIAVGYRCQLVDEIPADHGDIRPYQVICV
mgnify:FL=1